MTLQRLTDGLNLESARALPTLNKPKHCSVGLQEGSHGEITPPTI